MSAAPGHETAFQRHRVDYAILGLVAELFARVFCEKRLGRETVYGIAFQPRNIGLSGRSPIKIRKIPVEGGGWLPFSGEQQAHRVLGIIRGQIADGKTPRQAVTRYLPQLASDSRLELQYQRFLESKRRQHEHGSRQLSRERLDTLESHLRTGHLDPLLDIPVQLISYADLEDLRDTLFQNPGLGANSVRKVLQDLTTCLNWLYKRGDLDRVPARPDVQVPGYNPTIPSAAQQDVVFDAIPWERRGLFLARGLMGLRPSEARRANVSDYDWEAPALRIVGKGGKPRTVPAHPRLHTWITEHVDPRDRLTLITNAGVAGSTQPGDAAPAQANRAPLFTNPKADLAKNPDARWVKASEGRVMRAAYKAAKVARFRPNEFLRHAFGTEVATRLLTEGQSAQDVSRLIMAIMGHTEAKTSNRYVQLATAKLGWVYREG